MSDTSTPGERLDGLLGDLRDAVDAVRQQVQDRADAAGDRVVELVNQLSAKVDEIQAAWGERQGE